MAKGELTLELDEKDLARMNGILNGLSQIEREAVVQKGLQEGVRIFIKQGKSNLKRTLSKSPHNVAMARKMAAKRGGGLAKSFTTSTKRKAISGYAGFRRSTGGGISHLVDSGTNPRWTSKGYYRGSVSKGNPKTGSRFWRTAVQSKGTEALNELMDSIKKSVNTIITRGH